MKNFIVGLVLLLSLVAWYPLFCCYQNFCVCTAFGETRNRTKTAMKFYRTMLEAEGWHTGSHMAPLFSRWSRFIFTSPKRFARFFSSLLFFFSVLFFRRRKTRRILSFTNHAKATLCTTACAFEKGI